MKVVAIVSLQVISDRSFVHIGTIYFSMIFVSDRSENAFNGDT